MGTFDTQNNNQNAVGEDILLYFRNRTIIAYEDRLKLVKTINRSPSVSGLGYSFPLVGNPDLADIAQHTAGTQVDTSTIETDHVFLSYDDNVTYYSIFADSNQVNLNDFGILDKYSSKIGYILAQKYDIRVLDTIQTAMSTNGKVGMGNASVVVRPQIATATEEEERGNQIVLAIIEAMDDRHDRYIWDSVTIVTNATNYSHILLSKYFVNKDYRAVLDRFGIKEIIVSNTFNQQRADEKTVAFVYGEDVAGRLDLYNGVKTSIDYLPDYLGNLLLGKFFIGLGVLVPSQLTEIREAV
jgi:hypothetical protein